MSSSASSVSSSSSSSTGGDRQDGERPPEIILTGPHRRGNNQVTWEQGTESGTATGQDKRVPKRENVTRRSPAAEAIQSKASEDEYLRPRQNEAPIMYAYSSPNLRGLNNQGNYEKTRLMDSFVSNSINRENRNYVDPLYAQLNPTRNANKNKPVWSLNQPLPHVVDQGLVNKVIQRKVDGKSANSSRTGSANVSRSGSMTSMNDWRRMIRRAASNMKLTDLEAQRPGPAASIASSKAKTDQAANLPMTQDRAPKSSTPRHDVNFSLGDESYPASIIQEKAQGGRLNDQTNLPQADSFKAALDDTTSTAIAVDGNGGIGGDIADDSELETMTFPNYWAKIRYHMREPFAECFGTLVLVIFGVGGNLQATVTKGAGGSFESLSFAWGFGCMLGVYVAGGISGGHINPAVTISMAIFRKFPWKKVPVYIVAQIFGAFFGGAMAYGYFWSSITDFEGGKDIRTAASGACLFTNPKPYVTWRNAFFDEFIGAAMLVGCLMALLDDTNAPPANGMTAFVVGLLVAAIGMALGYQTSFTINPARDLGPRIFAAMIGYGAHPFHLFSWWWAWGAWGGPIAGGIAGALVYDLFIFTGSESPVNYPDKGYVEQRIGKLLHNDVQVANDAKSTSSDPRRPSNSSDTLVRNGKVVSK